MPLHHPYAPDVSTMVELLRWRAAKQPERVGFTFLPGGEEPGIDLTYGELDLRARATAAWLVARGGAGERVLLMFPEGHDYLVALMGCMYAGALAVPVHPPDPRRLHRTLPRVHACAENAGVRFVLTHRELAEGTARAVAANATLDGAEWLALESLSPEAADAWEDPGLVAHDLAYLQYTSGSTSLPKGVMISHHNLVHQLQDFDTGYNHDPSSVMVTWLPATHDLGLVYGRFMPLFVGFRCVYFSASAFMQRPARWLAALHKFGGTHSPSPNFGYEVAVRRSSPEDLANLDLSRVRVLLNGAEPIRESSEQLFIQALAPHGLPRTAVTHAMGMSESTAKIITEPIDRYPAKFVHIDPAAYEENRVVQVPAGTPGAIVVASNGSTVLDTRVVIADPHTNNQLPEDRVGELWVGGTTVAQGYWNNPAATEYTFKARLRDGTGPFLRTGDLAFIHQGEVYLTGRLKDVIIIRGQNHHPHDLEWTMGAVHEALRPNCAAAFSVEREGREQVVIVTEVYRHKVGEPEEVFGAVREALSEHGITADIVLIPPQLLPKTSSGKIQRSKTRELYLSGHLDIIAQWRQPSSQLQAPKPNDDIVGRVQQASGTRKRRILVRWIQGLAAELLGFDVEDIDSDRPLQELGLDSVTAVEMVERVGLALNHSIPGTLLFDYPAIDDIVGYILDDLLAAATGEVPRPDPAGRALDVASMSEEEATAALLRELEGL